MRNVSDKCCRGNQNTYFKLNNFFFENRVVYEIMWKYFVEFDSPQMTILCGARASQAAYVRLHTHAQKKLIIIAFSLQKLLRGRPSMLRLYFRCLSCLQSKWNVVKWRKDTRVVERRFASKYDNNWEG